MEAEHEGDLKFWILPTQRILDSLGSNFVHQAKQNYKKKTLPASLSTKVKICVDERFDEMFFTLLCKTTSSLSDVPESFVATKGVRSLVKDLTSLLLYDLCYTHAWFNSYSMQNSSSQLQDALLLNSFRLESLVSLAVMEGPSFCRGLLHLFNLVFNLTFNFFNQHFVPQHLVKKEMDSRSSRHRRMFRVSSLGQETFRSFSASLLLRRSTTPTPSLRQSQSSPPYFDIKYASCFSISRRFFSFLQSAHAFSTLGLRISVFYQFFYAQGIFPLIDSEIIDPLYSHQPFFLDTTLLFCLGFACYFYKIHTKIQEGSFLGLLNECHTLKWVQLTAGLLLNAKENPTDELSLNDTIREASKSSGCIEFTEKNNYLTENAQFQKEFLRWKKSLDSILGRCSFVILISGGSGCGKSTLALFLGRQLGCLNIVSTDTLRHVLRSKYSKEENPLLYSSTYNVDEALNRMTLEQYNKWTEKFTAFPNNCSECVKGYILQSRMLYETIELMLHETIRIGESLILEGIHLTGEIIQHLHDRFPTRCVSFFIYLKKEDIHIQRLANRSVSCESLASKNNYIKHLSNIRQIQQFLSTTLPSYVIPIENTALNMSCKFMHQNILNHLQYA